VGAIIVEGYVYLLSVTSCYMFYMVSRTYVCSLSTVCNSQSRNFMYAALPYVVSCMSKVSSLVICTKPFLMSVCNCFFRTA